MDEYSWVVTEIDDDGNIIVEHSEDISGDDLRSLVSEFTIEGLGDYKFKAIIPLTRKQAEEIQDRLAGAIFNTVLA